MSKLIAHNLRHILYYSDTLTIRFILAMGSLIWAFWVGIISLPYPPFDVMNNDYV